MLKRYKKPLIMYLFYNIVMLSILTTAIISRGSVTTVNFSDILPAEDIAGDIMLIFLVIMPIVSTVCALVFGFLLSPILMIVHYLIKKKTNIFGIDERPDSSKMEQLSRGLFPSIMAINFALMLCTNEAVINLVLSADMLMGGINPNLYIAAFVILVGFLVGVGYLIFSPIWFLTDAGIVYSNLKNESTNYKPVEAKTMGGWYQILFKGYAGIGTFISFYLFIITLITNMTPGNNSAYVGLILVVGLPFFAALATLPAVIILDRIKNIRNRYIRSIARKLGIKEKVKITFTTANIENESRT